MLLYRKKKMIIIRSNLVSYDVGWTIVMKQSASSLRFAQTQYNDIGDEENKGNI